MVSNFSSTNFYWFLLGLTKVDHFYTLSKMKSISQSIVLCNIWRVSLYPHWLVFYSPLSPILGFLFGLLFFGPLVFFFFVLGVFLIIILEASFAAFVFFPFFIFFCNLTKKKKKPSSNCTKEGTCFDQPNSTGSSSGSNLKYYSTSE